VRLTLYGSVAILAEVVRILNSYYCRTIPFCQPEFGE
jgi:hypothetical protein